MPIETNEPVRPAPLDVGDAQRPRLRPADWQLPQGVDRALWDYLNAPAIAQEYDDYFAHTNLLTLDAEFLTRHFARPGRLIDLGCGTGRLTAHFAAHGFHAVGVDLSDWMLGEAAAKRSPPRPPFDLVRANICRLEMFRDCSFDYACCMFSTLGMVVGADQRRQALREVQRLLRPGGLFGLHLHNRWYNLTDPQGRRWLVGDLVRRLFRSKSAGDKVMPCYRGIPGVRLHVFTLAEIRRTLREGGFQLVEILPLAPNRKGKLFASRFLGSLRSNGWLIMCRTPPTSRRR